MTQQLDNHRNETTPSTRVALTQFGINLNNQARQSPPTCIGRESEIQQCITVLMKQNKPNIMLLGPEGVGKSLIAEELARRIEMREVPDNLQNCEIISINIATTLSQGRFETNWRDILQESGDAKIILFIDEFHTAVGTGMQQNLDLSNMLKPYLARGDVKVIAATTLEEYHRIIGKNRALARRFQNIHINEPNRDAVKRILHGLTAKLSNYHQVVIPTELLDTAIELTDKFLKGRTSPDKEIDLIDEGCATLRSGSNFVTLPELKRRKTLAVQNKDFDKALRLHHQIASFQKAGSLSSEPLVLTRGTLEKVICKWANIPLTFIRRSFAEKISALKSELEQRIVGQMKAVESITGGLRIASLELDGGGLKPLFSALFIGPTGVGKTEMAKLVANVMHGDSNALLRLDMTEYQEAHTVSKLFGAPPGYVGYEQQPILVEHLRKHPFSVLLFDEIEKAHHAVWLALIPLLEEGSLTDGQGNRHSLANTIVILTSNLTLPEKDTKFGFQAKQTIEDTSVTDSKIRSRLSTIINPEIVNRLDYVVQFDRMTRENALQILLKHLTSVEEHLQKTRGVRLAIGQGVDDYLLKLAQFDRFGAREIKRVVNKEILERVAAELDTSGNDFLIRVNGEKLEIVSNNH